MLSSCCGLSQSRYKYGKKDACSLYEWIIYKRGSKAKGKERKGKEKKGKERKGKERKEKERKKKKRIGNNGRSYIQSHSHVRVI